MSGAMVNPQHAATAPIVRLDGRAIVQRYLAPFKAAEPFRDAIDAIDCRREVTQRSSRGSLIALGPNQREPKERERVICSALALRELVGPSLDAASRALAMMDQAMVPPPEVAIRAILGVMLTILRSKPADGDSIYVDALVMELTEPENDEPFCAPAIAAAARETWNTSTFKPAVAEFVPRVRRHQARIDTRSDLRRILAAHTAATEVLSKLAPETLEEGWGDGCLDDGWQPPPMGPNEAPAPF